jgi:hypothetical protein
MMKTYKISSLIDSEALESKSLSSIYIYIWSENFSHAVYEKSETKMAAIDIQIALKVVNIFNTISPQLIPWTVSPIKLSVHKTILLFFKSKSKYFSLKLTSNNSIFALWLHVLDSSSRSRFIRSSLVIIQRVLVKVSYRSCSPGQIWKGVHFPF